MKTTNHLHNLGLVFAGAALGASFLLVVQNSDESVIRSAEAAGGAVTGPNVEAPDRYVYYPGTEVLARDEVRVIACGTGMQDARRGAASACFVFEFGNGEKMIFDLGTGSMRNIASLMIPYEYLTKVFIGHLHTDHWGDLDQLWAGGWTRGPAGAARGLGAEWANP